MGGKNETKKNASAKFSERFSLYSEKLVSERERVRAGRKGENGSPRWTAGITGPRADKSEGDNESVFQSSWNAFVTRLVTVGWLIKRLEKKKKNSKKKTQDRYRDKTGREENGGGERE